MRKNLPLALAIAFVACSLIGNAQQTTSMGFLFFNGKSSNTNAELAWETIQELTVHHYNLQRSTDGVMFRTVSSCAALGDTSAAAKNKYKFTDLNAAAFGQTVFYRLECVDISGNPYYSKVLPLQFKGDRKLTVLGSNNVTETLWVNLVCSGKQIDCIVTDQSGNIVNRVSSKGEKGTVKKGIDVSNQPPGTYTLLIIENGSLLSERFIKH